jgi:signal transduction histidine kinase
MSVAVRARQWLRLLRTTVFRLALAYALAYSMLTGLVLGGVYFISSHFLQQQVDTELLDARDVLRRMLHDEGKSKMDLHELLGRPGSHLPGARLFLLVDQHKHVIAGSMSGWPKGLPLNEGFVTFLSLSGVFAKGQMHDADDSRMRGLITHLRDGGWLLIAQPLGEVDTFADTILVLLMLALVVISVLGIAGGALMGRGVLARIDAVRETAAEIMAGGLDQRIPVVGRRDEFVELAEHLNAMLARIEALIHGMRAVTDNVAHDLRSPLNRLRSHLEVALLESRSSEEYRQVLEEAVDELEGVVRTFNALLSIAQAESGVRREHLADVDLSALASDLAELYEAPAEDAGLVLAAEVTPKVRVRGQRELLAQALSNLLDNAVKYSPSGGRIELSLTREGKIALLRVCDSGPGIPVESREKVLERFARLDDARSTPGNGLGLALVKAVAQVHDARLELSDAGPGLCVELRFPVLAD